MRFSRLLPAVLMMIIIFLLSAVPSKEMPNFGLWDLIVKKGGHMTGYAILTLAYWFAFGWNKKYWWLMLLLTFFYACSDEFHQSFIPGRHPSSLDVGIDMVGAILGMTVMIFVRKKREIK